MPDASIAVIVGRGENPNSNNNGASLRRGGR